MVSMYRFILFHMFVKKTFERSFGNLSALRRSSRAYRLSELYYKVFGLPIPMFKHMYGKKRRKSISFSKNIHSSEQRYRCFVGAISYYCKSQINCCKIICNLYSFLLSLHFFRAACC